MKQLNIFYLHSYYIYTSSFKKVLYYKLIKNKISLYLKNSNNILFPLFNL